MKQELAPNYEQMPGHWLLASLGKKVLRPGGLAMTRNMLQQLQVTPNDKVVEFAPGLGITAKLILSQQPKQYIAIEQNEQAAKQVHSYLLGDHQQCIVASAEETGLDSHSASIIYGEAMLTMQSPVQKNRIVSEARRVLQLGGQYAIHEMCLNPDHISDEIKEEIRKDLASAIRVNARPLTVTEWKGLLEEHGFEVTSVETAPMHLLHPKRMIQDEGIVGVLKIMFNVLCNPKARRRVLNMRQTFMKHSHHLQAVSIVAKVNDFK